MAIFARGIRIEIRNWLFTGVYVRPGKLPEYTCAPQLFGSPIDTAMGITPVLIVA
jgi:hypothetical protein